MATQHGTRSKRGTATRATKQKNSLVANINRRRKAGTSRSKAAGTVSDDAYEQMKKGWPRSAKKKARRG